MTLETKTIKIIPCENYNIHVEEVSYNQHEVSTIMRSCYTKDDKYYIGDEKTADYLTKEKGLTQLQPVNTESKVCQIGFNEKTGQWFGWSHRAIYPFSVGSVVKSGDCAYKPSNVQEWINIKLDWYKDDDIGWGLGRIKSFTWDVPTNKLSITFHDSDVGVCETLDRKDIGNGNWEAKTLEDAKKMAIDFAESVSCTSFEAVSTSQSRQLKEYCSLPKNRIRIRL